ncbi:hypothetical protein FOL46_008820 [Perkinsus olseni]|uniref:Uncharacterized protein n=1 Tax=Perkinsus olseni TaxID=32597 RepID=A0A7J6L4U7_PEROL|nr:hypothetical protein FOL46_008820 [Perkinsus olseni]
MEPSSGAPEPAASDGIVSQSAAGTTADDAGEETKVPDVIVEEQRLNVHHRAKYISINKYKEVVKKLTALRQSHAQLYDEKQSLEQDMEERINEAVSSERHRAAVRLTAALAERTEDYDALVEKTQSDLRLATRKHSEQLERARHEYFVQTKHQEEQIEALKAANARLEREHREEIKHYKEENQSLLDGLEADTCEREKIARQVEGEMERTKLCFEEKELLKETLFEKEAEIENLKQQNMELREQVQLTEQLNEHHNERIEEYERESEKRLEQELHRSTKERKELEERHAGDIEERERKLEELLKHKEAALEEARLKAELLINKVRQHEEANEEIKRLTAEGNEKTRLQRELDKMRATCDTLDNDLQARKVTVAALTKENKRLQSEVDRSREQIEEKADAHEKAQEEIKILTEKLQKNKAECGAMEETLRERDLKMERMKRRSVSLEGRLKEVEELEEALRKEKEKRQELEKNLEEAKGSMRMKEAELADALKALAEQKESRDRFERMYCEVRDSLERTEAKLQETIKVLPVLPTPFGQELAFLYRHMRAPPPRHDKESLESQHALRERWEAEKELRMDLERVGKAMKGRIDELTAETKMQSEALLKEKNLRGSLETRLKTMAKLLDDKEVEFKKAAEEKEKFERELSKISDALRKREVELEEILKAHGDASAANRKLEGALREKHTNVERLRDAFKQKWEHRERAVLELHRNKEAAIGERQRAMEALKSRIEAQAKLLEESRKREKKLEGELQRSADERSALERLLAKRNKTIQELKRVQARSPRLRTAPTQPSVKHDSRIKALEKSVRAIPEILRSIHALHAKHRDSEELKRGLEAENEDLKYVLETRYPLRRSEEVKEESVSLSPREQPSTRNQTSTTSSVALGSSRSGSPPSSPGQVCELFVR